MDVCKENDGVAWMQN